MPTSGWIFEGDRDRILAARDPLPIQIEQTISSCPICSFTCDTASELNFHLSVTHPLDRPRLTLNDHEAPGLLDIFTPLRSESIAAPYAERIWLITDGQRGRDVSFAAFRRELARARSGQIEALLEHRRKEDGAVASARYVLRFEIPNGDALDRIDRAFLRILSRTSFNASDISAFVATCDDEIDARRYCNALTAYAFGVLIKDHDPSIRLPQAEYQNKMKEALHVLGSIPRGLSHVIASCIRLNLNHFGGDYVATGAVDLDRTINIFEDLARGVVRPPEVPRFSAADERLIKRLLPVDRTTASILDLVQIRHGPTPGDMVFETRIIELQGSTELTVLDRAKLNALLAAKMLLTDRSENAIEPLRALSNDAVLGPWANNQLKNLKVQ